MAIFKINLVFGTDLGLDPTTCILGFLEHSVRPGAMRIAVYRCLYQARKANTGKWIDPNPPSIMEWQTRTNNTIIRESLAYRRRGDRGRFKKILN